MKKFDSGFTLIELMIVLVIVAILLAVAIPSYSQYVERSRRNDAQAALHELAGFMERQYSNFGCYCSDPTDTPLTTADLPFGTTPKGASGANSYYTLTLATNSDGTTYTLTATPTAGSSQDDDPCGTLSLNQAGVEAVGGSATRTANQCW